MKEKIERMYENMGFDPDHKGTEGFIAATAHMMADRDAQMVRDVYPALAQARGTDWKSVERNMRYALRQAEESPNFDAYWRQQLGAWKDPTVHAVVRRVARWARAD